MSKREVKNLSKRDSSKASQKIWDILGEYGKVLEGLEKRPVWQHRLPLSELPYPREEIV